MISMIQKIKNPFLKYTAYRAFTMKTRLIMLGICGVISLPLAAFAGSLYEAANRAAQRQYALGMHVSSTTDGVEMFFMISLILTCVAGGVIFLMTYTGGVNCYEYFSRREKVDKLYSLPVKNIHRFWGDFVSGIAPIIITYVLSALLGFLILLVGMRDLLFKEIVPLVIPLLIIGLLFLFSLYIVVIFCAALCGRVFEAASYPALICGIIPAVVALCGFMIFKNAWQIDIGEQLQGVLTFSSPFGFLSGGIYDFINRYNFSTTNGATPVYLQPGIIIPFILVHAGFLTGAFYLAKKRHAESTGKAFVFGRTLTIISSLVLFCITATFCYVIAEEGGYFNGGVLFGLIMATLLAFLTLHVSANRGFKRMGPALGKYVIMVSGSAVVSSILMSVNGFGVGDYVPPMNRIESVSFNLTQYDCDSFNLYDYNYRSISQTTFTDEETIELLRGINTLSNNTYSGSSYYYVSGDSHMRMNNENTLTYTLKSGKEIKRRIRYTDETLADFLPILASAEYKQGIINAIESATGEKGGPAWAQVQNFGTNSNTHISNVQRIYDAWKLDFINETYEQKFLSTGRTYGYLEFTFSKDTVILGGHYVGSAYVYIREHHVNLLNELERQGINFPSAGTENTGLNIIKADYILAGENYAFQNHNSYYYPYSYKYSHGYIYVWPTEDTYDLIAQLLDVVQPLHMIDGPGYVLQGYGVIPPQYAHIAEELYKIGEWQNGNLIEAYDEWGGVYVEPDVKTERAVPIAAAEKDEPPEKAERGQDNTAA